jgi:hypothetical protein
MLAYELFMGRTVPNRANVSDEEWLRFIETEVTPNLPDGFTVYDASGAWYSPRLGRTIHQGSKVLMAAMPNTPAAHAAIERVRAAYKARFQQQVVGMVVTPVCAVF